MKNVVISFQVFRASVPVITLSACDVSSLGVSTMFLFRRLQPENTMCIWGRSHIDETEPALEQTQFIRLYRNTGRQQDFHI